MNTCDSCKWWGKTEEQYRGHDRVADIKTQICMHPKMKGYSVEDGCIHDLLECGPKFGCVHHEPK